MDLSSISVIDSSHRYNTRSKHHKQRKYYIDESNFSDMSDSHDQDSELDNSNEIEIVKLITFNLQGRENKLIKKKKILH